MSYVTVRLYAADAESLAHFIGQVPMHPDAGRVEHETRALFVRRVREALRLSLIDPNDDSGAMQDAAVELITEGERIKGGWETLCGDAWVDSHDIHAHVRTCEKCVEMARAEVAANGR